MSNSRASIFEESGELDVSGFAPKQGPDAKAPSLQEVRAVAESANFRSRETPLPKNALPPLHEQRRYRTGRNVQFNVKASRETVDAFYAVSDKYGWVLGEALERAIHALQRELDEKE